MDIMKQVEILENEHSRYVKRCSKMGESMQISDLWIFMTNLRGFQFYLRLTLCFLTMVQLPSFSKGTMGTSNGSSTTDFILLGFSDRPQLEHIISVVVFIFYIITLVGNTTIILVSYLDTQLHTPMYFFLSNLSFVDLCYTTSIIPQMLVNLWGPKKSITYGGCVLQFFFALDMGATECLLLAVMAYDRYAAVCQPLHYTVIMHPELCQKMVLIAWLGGLGSALTVCSLTLKLPRCGHREVDNFFCEMPALIKMACVYSKVIEVIVFALGVVFLLVPLSLILISYGVITQAVMRIKSAARWQKILNTCGSHLTVVSLFYGTIIYMYLKPQTSTSQDEGKFLTLFYTIVTPSLNPLIYTLRNKDVKSAIKRILWIKKNAQRSHELSGKIRVQRVKEIILTFPNRRSINTFI